MLVYIVVYPDGFVGDAFKSLDEAKQSLSRGELVWVQKSSIEWTTDGPGPRILRRALRNND
jgi:hypothetical protein